MNTEEFNNNYKLAIQHGTWSIIALIVWVLFVGLLAGYIDMEKNVVLYFIIAGLSFCSLLIILLHFRNKRAKKYNLFCPNCNFNYLSVEGHKRINDLLATGKCFQCNIKFLNHLDE